MARTCGVRIGRTDFELLILEGSVKKPSVVACRRGRIPEDSEDPQGDLIAALKEATKGLKVPGDAIGLVVDSGQAAFRTMTLPFDDAGKIEQVLKFEVESHIPQWEIDDVVVDFHTSVATGVESQILITVLPKAHLGEAITTATRSGLEPLEAEADSSAIVNAAWKAGVLSVDGAQVLVHVGRSSSSMIMVDGGVVRTMRAAHIGADHGSDETSRGRLLRELTRTVAAMQAANPLDGIYFSGIDFPGIVGEEIEDQTIQLLEPFEGGELPPGSSPSNFAAVFGAAIARMGGGPMKASLRREELRFTGKLERIELPLAVLALLLAALAGIWFVVLDKELKPLQLDMEKWLATSNTFMLGDAKRGAAGRLTQPSDSLVNLVKSMEDGSDDPFQDMQRFRQRLNIEINDLKKKLGQNTDVRKPHSAFGALTRVLDVLEGLGLEQTGYCSIRDVKSNFRPGRGTTKDHVEVELKMSFFADSGSQSGVVATTHLDNFRDAVIAEPWCISFPEVKSETLDNGKGVAVENIKIEVDMSILDDGEMEA